MLMALSPVLSHGVANSMALIHFTNCRDCWLYYRYRLHVQSPSCCQPDGPDPEQLVPVNSSRGCQLDGPVPEQLVEPIQVESPVNRPVRLLVICRLLSAQYPCRQDLTIASYD